MITRLAFPATRAHIDDLRRHARAVRVAEREERIPSTSDRVQQFGFSYRLPSGRWIHGTR